MKCKTWLLSHTDSKCSGATCGWWHLDATDTQCLRHGRKSCRPCCSRTYRGTRDQDGCLLEVSGPHPAHPPGAGKGSFLVQKPAVITPLLKLSHHRVWRPEKHSTSLRGCPASGSAHIQQRVLSPHHMPGPGLGTCERRGQGAKRQNSLRSRSYVAGGGQEGAAAC